MVPGESVDPATSSDTAAGAMAHPLGDEPGDSRPTLSDEEVCQSETSVSWTDRSILQTPSASSPRGGSGHSHRLNS